MKKLFKEFAAFINKGNALAMAIGVIIGGAFTKIVTAINAKIISPLIGALMGSSDLSGSMITVLAYQTDEAGNVLYDEATGEALIANAIYWGELVQAIIDFLLTAVILFAIFKIVGSIIETAKRTAERINHELEERIKGEQSDEAVVEAEPVVEAAPVVEEVKVSEDILLLQEIRDLLAKNVKSEEVSE